MTEKRSVLRAVLRCSALLAVTAVLVPPFLLGQALNLHLARASARLWHRVALRIAGVAVRRYGRPSEAMPTLFVANHVSYLDVPAIGAVVDAIFVAKREVEGWPLLGFLARVGRTVFIERNPAQAAAECALLRRRLAKRESLLLFPEGTSSDGSDVLPFKSSLFEAATLPGRRSVPVQPISLAYRGFRGGAPFAGEERLLYAWCGDATMVPHVWTMLSLPGAEVIMQFHPPVAPETFASRKALAEHAQKRIASGLSAGLGGQEAAGVADDEALTERPAIAAGG